ncbi:MAG: hypothetical protein ACKPB3_04760, partial [Bacteroidota bacterium]
MIKNLMYFFLLVLVVGCTVSKKTNSAKTEDVELDKFTSLMEGKFSSELQSKTDSSYFDISLVMTPIWTN